MSKGEPDRADKADGRRAAPAPSSEAIAKRAYELYLQRGSISGYELEDWLQAEAELTAASAPKERKR
jgi:hypothetical protein